MVSLCIPELHASLQTMTGDWASFFRDRRKLAVLVGLPLVAGVILGANQTRAGAFLPWGLSIAYWTSTSITTWWLIAAATAATGLLLRPWSPPSPAIWLFGGIAGSFLARPAIYGIVEAFRPAMTTPILREMIPVTADLAFLTHYLTNWSTILLMWCASSWWMAQARPLTVANDDIPDLDLPALQLRGMLLRLPPAIGCDVVAVQAEDHYVRFHTAIGGALVLGSLSQAIADLEASGFVGRRTHRSWWVVNKAVATATRSGRHVHLHLLNGVEVPVSVSYRALADAPGLLSS